VGGFGIVEIDGVQPTLSGQLPVVSTPPEPPPGTDPVPSTDRLGEGNVTNTTPQEVAFAIPSDKKLTITQLTGAAESSVAGARVDLLHSDGSTEQRIAAPLFLNGATQQIALMKSFASGSIVLRRTNNSGAPSFIYAEWDGFLEDA
jgi:hypothetical protein